MTPSVPPAGVSTLVTAYTTIQTAPNLRTDVVCQGAVEDATDFTARESTTQSPAQASELSSSPGKDTKGLSRLGIIGIVVGIITTVITMMVTLWLCVAGPLRRP